MNFANLAPNLCLGMLLQFLDCKENQCVSFSRARIETHAIFLSHQQQNWQFSCKYDAYLPISFQRNASFHAKFMKEITYRTWCYGCGKYENVTVGYKVEHFTHKQQKCSGHHFLSQLSHIY